MKNTSLHHAFFGLTLLLLVSGFATFAALDKATPIVNYIWIGLAGSTSILMILSASITSETFAVILCLVNCLTISLGVLITHEATTLQRVMRTVAVAVCFTDMVMTVSVMEENDAVDDDDSLDLFLTKNSYVFEEKA